jgi:hypothetical protein
MYRRLEVISERLDTLGLTHHSGLRMMQERIAPEHAEAVRVLGSAVEPVKGYSRTHLYNADTPMNALPDSIPPESITVRKFSILVDRIIAGNASPEDLAVARETLNAWKDNDPKVAPALQNSAVLAPDAPVSQNLSTAASVGLQALDMIANHTTAQAGWADQQIAQLEQMKKPQAALLLIAVDPVEKLVQAAAK